MTISVIISTYNKPTWLEKVLWGYACQTETNFDIVIADDGSDTSTLEMLARMRRDTGLPIHHVWHDDRGFRKTVILNKAIGAATGSYLIFTDGDCIPRHDFIALHRKYALPGAFLSGGYFKLPLCVSNAIDINAIRSGNAFCTNWLQAVGTRWDHKLLRLALPESYAQVYQALTTTKATFNGCNSSAWKDDILRVNGFDERMVYGAEDRELGTRLENAGVRARSIRYTAHVLHLDHARGYATREGILANRKIWKATQRSRAVWTEHGIVKGAPQPNSVVCVGG